MPEPVELMDVALRLAREAGVLIREGRSSAEVASTKSSDIDIVTQMDVASETLLRERLAQWRPDDAILGEEGDDTPGTSGITWVLDPIDGTVNYFYGIPHYAVSVAAVTGDVRNGAWTRIAGAVYDGEGVEWTAALGHGAYRNGVRLDAHRRARAFRNPARHRISVHRAATRRSREDRRPDARAGARHQEARLSGRRPVPRRRGDARRLLRARFAVRGTSRQARSSRPRRACGWQESTVATPILTSRSRRFRRSGTSSETPLRRPARASLGTS